MLSDGFMALTGIHQGAPCSMLLFTFFGNSLLEELCNFASKVIVCNECINCMAFADDMTLIARCKTDLQSLFDIAVRYSKRWRFSYNPAKCAIMVFGKDSQPDIQVLLGNSVLKKSNCEPHLGGYLVSREKEIVTCVRERIKKCKTVCYAANSIGSKQVPLNPVVATKLYNSIALPKLCYGTEILELTDECVEDMEQFHVNNAKLFQGLPQNASNVGSVGSIGWKSVQTHIDILRLLFMWRILLLPMGNLYKNIMLKRIIQCFIRQCKGPVYQMIETCRKYGLYEYLYDSVVSGQYATIHQFKSLVKQKSNATYIQSWKITCCFYKSLSMYNTNVVSGLQMISWWKVVYDAPERTNKCRLIVKLLLNVYRLGKKMCHLCDSYRRDSITHILFECDFVKDVRTKHWKKVASVCPLPLFNDMMKMTLDDRCAFLLSGLNAPYIDDWQNVYVTLLDFMYHTYIRYHNASNIVDGIT